MHSPPPGCRTRCRGREPPAPQAARQAQRCQLSPDERGDGSSQEGAQVPVCTSAVRHSGIYVANLSGLLKDFYTHVYIDLITTIY